MDNVTGVGTKWVWFCILLVTLSERSSPRFHHHIFFSLINLIKMKWELIWTPAPWSPCSRSAWERSREELDQLHSPSLWVDCEIWFTRTAVRTRPLSLVSSPYKFCLMEMSTAINQPVQKQISIHRSAAFTFSFSLKYGFLFEGEVLFFTFRLMIRIFMIIYSVVQHYYDEWCSPESWSSLLTSSLAENSRGACAPDSPPKK